MLFTSNKLNISFTKVLFLVINLAIILSARKKKKTNSTATKERVKVQYTSRVLNLTDETFGEFNRTNKQFYLYFMSNNCTKCNIFNPSYEQVSDQLYNSELKIPCVQVNIDLNPNLAKHYDMEKVPKLFFANYLENEFFAYSGGNKPRSLMQYINYHLNYTTEEIKDWNNLLESKKNGIYLIFIGDQLKYPEIYKKIIKASRQEDIDIFRWSTSQELHDKFGVPKNSFDVVMLKKSKKKGLEILGNLNIKEDTSVDDIENIIEIHERKMWGKADDFSLLLAMEINPPTPTVFVIYSAKSKEHIEYNKDVNTLMEKISKKYFKNFHFMNLTISNEKARPFVKVFNLKKNSNPYLILVDNNKKYVDDVEKYMLPVDQKINEENVEKFLNDFKSKKLQKIAFSEPLDQSGFSDKANHLVALSYENFLYKENVGKDIIFCLYSEHMDQTNELFEARIRNTMRKLKGNSHIIFAKSNPILNELPEFAFDVLPALYFIKGNTETERRMNIKKYDMQTYYTRNFVDFIKQHSSESVSEVVLENEEEVLRKEIDEEFIPTTKEEEEDRIDYNHSNCGLRRLCRYILEGKDDEDEDEDNDEDEDENEDEDVRKKSGTKKDSKRKDDL
jgi:thiol-disulfide isomerase/thioredoxin